MDRYSAVVTLAQKLFMPFYNFNAKNKIKLWDGINGSFFHSDKLTLGQVIVDKGTILPEHKHPQEQWMLVVEGEVEFSVNGEIKLLSPGMCAHIPSDTLHTGKAITECKLMDFFFPVREDFVALEKEQSNF